MRRLVFPCLLVTLCILALSVPASAQLSPPNIGVSPSSITVPPCSTFSIDISITDIDEAYPCYRFKLVISWDHSLMELTETLDEIVNRESSSRWQARGVSPLTWSEYGDSMIIDAGVVTPYWFWDNDLVWLTLNFHCLSEGTSQIKIGDYLAEEMYIYLWDGVGAPTTPTDVYVPCNQRQQAPSDPYHYVGGSVFSANKLAVLSPYLALFSAIAVAAVVVKKKLT